MVKRKANKMSFILYNENCLNAMKRLEDNSVDSIVTDPPYGLSFMGKKWDYDVPSQEIWAECLRVLKPGGHLLAFAGTRTQHRMAVRIEDAGFEIRDMIAWVYGSGFPKSHDVSKAIDKQAGAERELVGKQELTSGSFNAVKGFGGGATTMNGEKTPAKTIPITTPATEAAKQWEGWGTALKPALEPITVARKPLIGTVAENVLAHGTGGLNIDGCRVGAGEFVSGGGGGERSGRSSGILGEPTAGNLSLPHTNGRWPANLIHDGSDEVVGLFPQSNGMIGMTKHASGTNSVYGDYSRTDKSLGGSGSPDKGSAARFFYCAKASKKDRDEGLEGFPVQINSNGDKWSDVDRRDGKMPTPRQNIHPTVKPTDLMRYLCRLITPPNGVILDPFMGSGSTGKAAMLEGFQFIGCELSPEYMEIAKARIEAARVQGAEKPQQPDNLELF
jgi:site-specific DNA-methyltransferase (adenine-specific)